MREGRAPVFPVAIRRPPEAGTLLDQAKECTGLRISKVLRPGGAGFGAEPQYYKAVKRTAAEWPLASMTVRMWKPFEGTTLILCSPWVVWPR